MAISDNSNEQDITTTIAINDNSNEQNITTTIAITMTTTTKTIPMAMITMTIEDWQ